MSAGESGTHIAGQYFDTAATSDPHHCSAGHVPVRNLKYLNLCALHQSQRNARWTGCCIDWTGYNKVSAAFRCHTRILQRVQCRLFCASLNMYTPTPKIWRIVKALLGMPEPRNHFASLAIIFGFSFLDVVERFPDKLSHPSSAVASIDWCLIPIGQPLSPYSLDEKISLSSNFRRLCAKRRALLVRPILHIRRYVAWTPHITILFLRFTAVSSVLEFFWSSAIVCSVLKLSKSPNAFSSLRSIALMSCVGKVMKRMVQQGSPECWKQLEFFQKSWLASVAVAAQGIVSLIS